MERNRPTKLLIFKNKNEGGAYDENELIIPASDTKGHSERIWFRCQPGYVREAKIALAEGKLPWKSMGDLLRFALDQTVRWAVKAADCQKHSIMPQIDMINNLVRDELAQQSLIESFKDIEKTIPDSGPRSRHIANIVWKQIKAMPAGYWKDQYKIYFLSKYKSLIGGVNLKDTSDHDDDETDDQN